MQIFFSGDDTQAKASVAQLIRDLGGEPIDAGSLVEGGKLHGMGGPLSLKLKLLSPKESEGTAEYASLDSTAISPPDRRAQTR